MSKEYTPTARGMVRDTLRNYESRELEDAFTEQIDSLIMVRDMKIALLERTLKGCAAMLHESAKQHRIRGDAGHVAMAEAHRNAAWAAVTGEEVLP